ncbi:hypothetical protein TNCV_3971691 [Trichonephila clavipes]|nr:hypothetical protein TNCV_3971691 [Trichonephila clavipes]
MGHSGHCGVPIPRLLERAEVVAHFRLTTGYDFLEVYLHCLRLAVDFAYPLCGHATDNIVSQYWKTRRKIVKMPSTGVDK